MNPKNENPEQQSTPFQPETTPQVNNPVLNSVASIQTLQAGNIISGGVDPSLMPNPPKQKNKKIYVLTCVVVAVILIVAGGVLLMLNSNNSSSSEEPAKKTSPTEQEPQSGNSQVPTKKADLPNTKDSKDSERKSDIDKATVILNSYGNDEVTFPTLKEINDPTFRKQNIPMLSDELLREPDSAQSVYAGAPSKGAYSYEPLDSYGKACDNTPRTTITPNGPFACTQYKLTAILDDGTKYEKVGKSPEF